MHHERERIRFHRARSAGLQQGRLLRVAGMAIGSLGAVFVWFAMSFMLGEDWAPSTPLRRLVVVAMGLGLLYGAWRLCDVGDPKRRPRRRKATSPAMADFDWDPRGIDTRPYLGLPLKLLGAAVLTPILFLAVPVSEGGSLNDNLPQYSILGGCVFALGLQGYRFVRALKHGTCHLAFECFPFASGERLALRFTCPGDLNAFDRFELTLRYVQEAREERDRHGRDPSHIEVVSYALWTETKRVDHDKLMHARGDELPIAFDLPESAPPTRLATGTTALLGALGPRRADRRRSPCRVSAAGVWRPRGGRIRLSAVATQCSTLRSAQGPRRCAREPVRGSPWPSGRSHCPHARHRAAGARDPRA